MVAKNQEIKKKLENAIFTIQSQINTIQKSDKPIPDKVKEIAVLTKQKESLELKLSQIPH